MTTESLSSEHCPELGSETLASLGERGLLQLIRPFCLPGVVGDDAAILPAPDGQLVVTTDVLVDGVHFSDLTTPPHAVGWRAAAANLSDLAAMGAQPLGLTVGLSLPSTTAVTWVRELYRGLTDCCRPWKVGIAGGDVTRASQRFVAITAWGQVQADRAIWRSRSAPEDWLIATGAHGNSRAGLELLLNAESIASISPDDAESLTRAHQYPQPRLDVTNHVPELWQVGGRIGGMDTSDGLADAIVQVCAASGVGAIVEPEWLPIHPALGRVFPDNAQEWALYGGEDFELLLSLPEAAAKRAIALCPGATRIGTVTAEEAVKLSDGSAIAREPAFQHF